MKEPTVQPLTGLTVIALEQAVAAPFASRQLADLGARVIKIERPGEGDFARGYDRSVDGDSSYFVWLNRGKESIELDLKDPASRSLLDALISGADVMIQNLVPGAVERLGLDSATLRARHPRLIHCSISGYGPGGPFSDKKAYDLLLQCETGLVSVTGTPEEPVKVGISIADISAGMYAFSGILTALYERENTGAGSTLHIAMIDAIGEWMLQPMYYSVYGMRPNERSGARHASIAPYGPYSTADGQVFIGVQSDREWRELCREVINRPDLADDSRFAHNPERVANDAELTPIIEAALRGLTVEAAMGLLEDRGIACARLRTAMELFTHPQLRARDRWRRVETPHGSVEGLLPAVTVSGREPLMGPVPALGQHTAAIRAEYAAEPSLEGM